MLLYVTDGLDATRRYFVCLVLRFHHENDFMDSPPVCMCMCMCRVEGDTNALGVVSMGGEDYRVGYTRTIIRRVIILCLNIWSVTPILCRLCVVSMGVQEYTWYLGYTYTWLNLLLVSSLVQLSISCYDTRYSYTILESTVHV